MYTSTVIDANRVMPPTKRPDLSGLYFEPAPSTPGHRFPDGKELKMPHYLMPDTFEDGLSKTDRPPKKVVEPDANVHVLLEHQSKVNTQKNNVQQWLQENIEDPDICTCFPKVTTRLNPTMIYDEKKPCPYHSYIKPEEVYKFTHPWTAEGVRPRARHDNVAYDMLVVDHDGRSIKDETPLSQYSKPRRSVETEPPGRGTAEKVTDPKEMVPGTAPPAMQKNAPKQPRYKQGATQQTHFMEDGAATVSTPFIRVEEPTRINHRPFVNKRHGKEDTMASSFQSESNRSSVPLGTPIIKPGRKSMSYHGYDDDEHLSKDIHESYANQMKHKWEKRGSRDKSSEQNKITARKHAPTVSSPRRYYNSYDPNARNSEDEEEIEKPKPIKKREFVGEYVDPRTGKVYEFEVRHGRDSIRGNKAEIPR